MLEAVGFAAGILGIVAWIPQVKTVWIDKRHDGVSLPTFAVVAVALTLWMIYGIMLPSPSIIFSNAAALLMILSVIIGVARIRLQQT
jgi:MtN3 and saliva related transmembrane protein|tara:strand:+ start:2036 stop:2296 length:261 start_codon:yes stop_codon:yes gene_type:complete